MTATISRPKISNWETSNIPNLTGKTALITGANSGLGYYTAKALACLLYTSDAADDQ